MKKVLTILFLIFFAQHSYAIGEDFSVNFIPSYPLPNKEATLKINSNSFDVNRSNITWVLSGKTVKKGVGEKMINFEMPNLGKTKSLSVYITTDSGVNISKSLSIKGNDIDILIEPNTYTPYWYLGSPLPVVQSQIDVLAIPYIYSGSSRLSTSKLQYEWYLNYEKVLNASGYGKNTFNFSIDNYNDNVIGVKISNSDKSIVFEKNTRISTSDIEPNVIFYEDHPLLGVLYNNPIVNTFSLLNDTINIIAEPFFFSKTKDEDISFEWNMNNEEILESKNKRTLFLEKPIDVSGSTTINLNSKNISNILQFAEEILSISF